MNKSDLGKFINFTKKWEGGLSRYKSDSASKNPNPLEYKGKKGWHTNMGITYAAWNKHFPDDDEGFFNMDADKWFKIFKEGYWDSVRGDELPFSIAVYVTGIAWGSGPNKARRNLQQALQGLGQKIEVDGVIGKNTLRAVSAVSEQKLFDALVEIRRRFFHYITNPSNAKDEATKEQYAKNAKFLNGWINRLEDYVATFRP